MTGNRQTSSFSRRDGARALPRYSQASPSKYLPKEGRRSADRRTNHWLRHTCRCCHLPVLRARPRPQRRPLASRRSTAALATQINAMAQPRPRFARNSGQRRYLRHESRLQRCTSRAGHYAGRVDARTARERGYKPRPQEPHSPHQSAVTGRRPFDGRDSMRLSNGSGDGCQEGQSRYT
jgi:hypothetical protein